MYGFNKGFIKDKTTQKLGLSGKRRTGCINCTHLPALSLHGRFSVEPTESVGDGSLGGGGGGGGDGAEEIF